MSSVKKIFIRLKKAENVLAKQEIQDSDNFEKWLSEYERLVKEYEEATGKPYNHKVV